MIHEVDDALRALVRRDALNGGTEVDEAERAYRWFLVQNDLDLPLASADDGGCFDGLMPTGLNRNQGAESILALQLASCAISALGNARRTVPEPMGAAA